MKNPDREIDPCLRILEQGSHRLPCLDVLGEPGAMSINQDVGVDGYIFQK